MKWRMGMAGIKDIAEAAGVSLSTVSNVIIGKQCVECKGTEKTRTYGFTCTDQSGRQGTGSASHPGTYEGLCLLLRQKK